MAPRWYVVVCWVFAALFATSAALQYNDPDPLRWVALYGSAMVAAIALPLARAYRWARPLAYLVAAVAGVWAVTLLISIWGEVRFADFWQSMDQHGGAVEEQREAGGLAIVGGFLVVAAALRRRWKPRFTPGA